MSAAADKAPVVLGVRLQPLTAWHHPCLVISDIGAPSEKHRIVGRLWICSRTAGQLARAYRAGPWASWFMRVQRGVWGFGIAFRHRVDDAALREADTRVRWWIAKHPAPEEEEAAG
jgi:hypothetical protein